MCARARRREEAQRAESSEWHMRHVSDPPAGRVQCVCFCRRRGVLRVVESLRERESGLVYSSLYYGELCIVSGTACAERVMSICSSFEKLVGRGSGMYCLACARGARGGAASRITTGKKKPGSTCLGRAKPSAAEESRRGTSHRPTLTSSIMRARSCAAALKPSRHSAPCALSRRSRRGKNSFSSPAGLTRTTRTLSTLLLLLR